MSLLKTFMAPHRPQDAVQTLSRDVKVYHDWALDPFSELGSIFLQFLPKP